MNIITLLLLVVAAYLVWKNFIKKEKFTVKTKREADLFCFPQRRDRYGNIYYTCQYPKNVMPPEHAYIPRASPTPKGVHSILQDFF